MGISSINSSSSITYSFFLVHFMSFYHIKGNVILTIDLSRNVFDNGILGVLFMNFIDFGEVTLLYLQTHQVYSTLKRRGDDYFHLVSTWNTRGVFVRYSLLNSAPCPTLPVSFNFLDFDTSNFLINEDF